MTEQATGPGGLDPTDAGSPPDQPDPDHRLEFVVLTGMSGAGRSTVANVLEDMGWFVVDNLPPQLLTGLSDLAVSAARDRPTTRVVAVVDVRSRGFFDDLSQATRDLQAAGWSSTVVFLDATDEALVRRFESVRRPHPLQGDGRLLDGITAERERLTDLRSQAGLLIDTSGLNVHQLGQKVRSLFSGDSGPALRMAVMSFGFKYGVPLDADFVFDTRFLPNPFWIPALRPQTGLDAAVVEFVMEQPGAAEFVERVQSLLEPVREGYRREGRRYVTVAVGCTGGKHRSVALAEELVRLLASDSVQTFAVHRDLGRE